MSLNVHISNWNLFKCQIVCLVINYRLVQKNIMNWALNFLVQLKKAYVERVGGGDGEGMGRERGRAHPFETSPPPRLLKGCVESGKFN